MSGYNDPGTEAEALSEWMEAASIVCRRCGADGLRWGRDGNRWRLYDEGEMHVCDDKFQIEKPASVTRAGPKATPRGKMVEVKCRCCGSPFTARLADRKRGWARFCSKSCKAKHQEARTGQYSRYLNTGNFQ